MSQKDIDELAAAVAEPETVAPPVDDQAEPAGDAGEPVEPETLVLNAPDPGMVHALKMLFTLVGDIVAVRFGVAPLSPSEAGHLGASAATVAAQYDFEMDPKMAAWFGLGMASFAVVGPRLQQYRANVEAAATVVDPPVDPPADPPKGRRGKASEET
jgi:hypothetical protein